MSGKGKNFKERIKYTVDYSQIDFEKYRNSKPNKSVSDDPNKGQRERTKEESYSRYKTFSQDSNCEFNEFTRKFKNGFSPEMLAGEKLNNLIDKVISLESIYLGISPPKWNLYFDIGKNASFGMYVEKSGIAKFSDECTMEVDADTIYINSAIPIKTENDYREFLNTLLHELRHKFQDRARENSEKYSDVSISGYQYLEYSEENYENDIKTNEGYINNGLEQDSRAFANSRTEQYIALSIDELLSLNQAPDNIAVNQILMEAGDIFRNGKRAPITVSKTFDNKEFKKFSKSKNGSINKSNKYKGGNGMAQMTAGTDFSEQAQEEAAKVYGEVIENIQLLSEKLVEHFIERVKTHPFKQLENVGNVFIRFYNDELPKKIDYAINDWISSDNSFTASLRKQYEGDEAASVSAAQKTERRLSEKVSTCFKNIQPIKISKPISIDKQMIISDAAYVENFSKQLIELKEQCLDRFQKLSERNSLYATMMPMVATTFTNVESAYQAAYKDIMDVSEEFRDARDIVVERDINKTTEVKANIEDRLDSFKSSRKNMH